jgi:hypothetical protein
MSFGEIVFALVMSGILGLWLYGIIITDGDTIRRILWDDTMLGWGWRKLFGEKKKAKQAPINVNPSWYVPASAPPAPPARTLTAKKAAPKGFIPKGFSTSSLNVPPLNHIGKPLVIQNWDRLAGMATMVFGRRWIVVHAFHTSNGYEFTLQTGGMTKSVTFYIYDTMYDSHRVSVYCEGRTEIMDVGVCKDPNRLLHEVTYMFNEKFR